MEKIKFPVWFLIFPENKQFKHKTKEILSLNRKFAVEHQLPAFSFVLMPKVEVTHAALHSFINRLDDLYDFTIVYKDNSVEAIADEHVPCFNQMLYSKSIEIHVLIRHFSKEKLLACLSVKDFIEVKKREQILEFLIGLFYQKDKNLENFYTNPREMHKYSSMANLDLLNLNLKSVVPGFLFFSITSLLLLNSKIGRKIFVRAYLFGWVLPILF